MPSAMSRLLILLSAGLAICGVAPVSFAQPTTKQPKKTTAQKPYVVTVHSTIAEAPKPPSLVAHTVASASAVKTLHFSMRPEPTFAPMDAWAYADKAGNGNVVHQTMSMRSPVMETLARGTRIEVVGRGTDLTGRVFYEVQTPDSRTGWMEPGSLRFQ